MHHKENSLAIFDYYFDFAPKLDDLELRHYPKQQNMDEEKVEWLGKARVVRLTCAQTCKKSINILDQKKRSRLECITCLLS